MSTSPASLSLSSTSSQSSPSTPSSSSSGEDCMPNASSFEISSLACSRSGASGCSWLRCSWQAQSLISWDYNCCLTGYTKRKVHTVWQVSRQSRASLASSCHDNSSSFPPDSWACSAIRKKHQPSRYHASTSWSSKAMIPCKTRRAGVNSESSRNSFTRDKRVGIGGNFGSSTLSGETSKNSTLIQSQGWFVPASKSFQDVHACSKHCLASSGRCWDNRTEASDCRASLFAGSIWSARLSRSSHVFSATGSKLEKLL